MNEDDEKQPESNESDRHPARTNPQYGGYGRSRQPDNFGNSTRDNQARTTSKQDYPRQGIYHSDRPNYSDTRGAYPPARSGYGNSDGGGGGYRPRTPQYRPPGGGGGGGYGYNNRPNDNRGGGYRRDDEGQGGYQQNRSPYRSKNNKPFKKNKEPLQPKARVKTITLLKALTRLNYASPKICLQHIVDGKVIVNSEAAYNQNLPVAIIRDTIVSDSITLQPKQPGVYIVMNKPRHVSGSMDKQNSIYQMMHRKKEWNFPIGCLDKASNGIVIITNDRTHKSSSTSPLALLEKEYHIKIHKVLTPKEIAKLELTLCKDLNETIKIDLVSANTRNTVISIASRNDLETLTFERKSFANLFSTDTLRPGSWRQLNQAEIKELMGDAYEFKELLPAPQPKRRVQFKSRYTRRPQQEYTPTPVVPEPPPASKWQKLKKQLLGGI
ncbi:MAG: hypothetical protein IPM69_15550 [Ignavibacteria bacterium]|nr:hypothetical protein [Ignavibacteria bacterium]